MSNKEYNFLLKKLFSINLHSGMKLGLENILKLHKIFKTPADHYSCVHVAGTNGKGSVVTKIAAALQLESKTVGLYTSPHISSFRERVQVNGEPIDESSTIKLLNKIFEVIEKEHVPATFFEITTLLAFLYFKEKGVDYAILETGLGGRLDATNIVKPALTIITSISLEHTEYLGNTLEDITKEKAGIIKPNTPIIIGPCVPVEVIKKIAKDNMSPLTQVTGHFINFNEENNAIARKALERLGVSETSIEEGLKKMPPCRLEILQNEPIVILDVAHNPDGLERLFKSLQENYPGRSLRIVFGLSKNKDIEGCLHILQQHGSKFHLIEAQNGRGVKVEVLRNIMIDHSFSSKDIFIDDTIKATIQQALKEAKAHNQILVICGSFFIMGAARTALGKKEIADDIDVNEAFKHC